MSTHSPRVRLPRSLSLGLLFMLPVISLAAACGGDTEVVDPKFGGPTMTAVPGGAANPAAAGGSDSSRLASTNASPVATLGTSNDGAAPASSAAGSVPAAAEAPTNTPVPPTQAPPTQTPVPAPTATAAPVAPTATKVPAPPPAPAAPLPNSDPANLGASQALGRINTYRQEMGVEPLRGDAALNAEAQAYAKLMGDTNTFGHNGPDGSTAISRVQASGYAGSMCGEAIAAGQTTSGAAFSTWRDSPEHNAIMLSPNAEAIGVGYYQAPNSTYKHYWVLVTGKAAAFCPG